MTRDVLLGVVIAAQGLKGAVRVKAFTETPASLARYGALHLKDGRQFNVADLRMTAKDEAVVSFEGVADRATAEALKGAQLYVARTALPPPGPEEFYHTDLIGLMAEDTAGRAIGTVAAIHNFGAGDVIEIARASSDGRNSVHLPFTSETVPRIDVAKGLIVVASLED